MQETNAETDAQSPLAAPWLRKSATNTALLFTNSWKTFPSALRLVWLRGTEPTKANIRREEGVIIKDGGYYQEWGCLLFLRDRSGPQGQQNHWSKDPLFVCIYGHLSICLLLSAFAINKFLCFSNSGQEHANSWLTSLQRVRQFGQMICVIQRHSCDSNFRKNIGSPEWHICFLCCR